VRYRCGVLTRCLCHDDQDLTNRFPPSTVVGRYVRRVVFSVLNRVAETVQHNIGFDVQTCNYICSFWRELYPFDASEDLQCHQWVESSLLLVFIEACQAGTLQEFQALSVCDDEYTSLKHFICSAKQQTPSMTFLDDDLFAAASGMEIISESMRRRLSVAGVWAAGDPKKSFVVKPEDVDAAMSEMKASTTITPWQPRGVNVGRIQAPNERVSRNWCVPCRCHDD